MIQFRPYQSSGAAALADIIQRKGFALDASDTGVGKTFTAIAVALEFADGGDPPPVAVICRASARTKWHDALEQFGIRPVFLLSWEKARNKKNEFFLPITSPRGKIRGFNLRLPSPTLVIIDEIHAAGSMTSQNSKLVIAAAQCPKASILGLSASIADNPLKMYALGFCTRFHSLNDDYYVWCRRNGCSRSPFGGMYFRVQGREQVLLRLHKQLFGEQDPWGIRLRKKDLMAEGQFPSCETFVELWDVGTPPAWLRPWTREIDEVVDADMERHRWDPHAGIIALRDRQKAEMLKVPNLTEELEALADEGESIIVFLQFTRTIEAVSERLAEKKIEHSVFAGKVPDATLKRRGVSSLVRADEIARFQSGDVRVILCQTDAGSESIDLHDVIGGHPRHVIIFPTYKAVTLIQALGRAVRSGALTPVVQRIVYSAGGIEEKIAKAVERRLENLSALSDGELNASGML